MKQGTVTSPEGLWLINKPLKKSSFWVVGQLRRLTGIRKVGHAGTLDPLAEGLMILLVGKEFTRQADSFLKLDKEYILKFKLGETSMTDDGEGEKALVSDRQPELAEIQAAIQQLTGEILQTPPIYSALKIGGQRAYKLARAGKPVTMTPRPVTVYSWQDVEYDYPYLSARVKVSSGTYIRSLARSLGEILEVGAYLSALQRTQIGEYQLSKAIDLEGLENSPKN